MTNLNWETVWVGMGSNLNQPIKQLLSAKSCLEQSEEIRALRLSSFYQSKPLGPQDQPDFVNAVCTFETQLNPLDLLQFLQSIEHKQGRQRLRHWGERTLDLDILLYGNRVENLPQLTIPHIEMLNRAFVVYPMLELESTIILPTGETLKSKTLPTNDLVRLDSINE